MKELQSQAHVLHLLNFLVETEGVYFIIRNLDRVEVEATLRIMRGNLDEYDVNAGLETDG